LGADWRVSHGPCAAARPLHHLQRGVTPSVAEPRSHSSAFPGPRGGGRWGQKGRLYLVSPSSTSFIDAMLGICLIYSIGYVMNMATATLSYQTGSRGPAWSCPAMLGFCSAGHVMTLPCDVLFSAVRQAPGVSTTTICRMARDLCYIWPADPAWPWVYTT
jgi:hypothetical protein